MGAMSILQSVGLHFQESMSGYLGKGQSDPAKGEELGRHQGDRIRFDVRITIQDLSRFVKITEHQAALTGTVTSSVFGGTYPIVDGAFRLFSIDPATGIRQMVYAFKFTAADGRKYYLHGHKAIHHHRGKADVVERHDTPVRGRLPG